ncbi:hypothetical protein D3C87_1868240 [compost metagenome]
MTVAYRLIECGVEARQPDHLRRWHAALNELAHAWDEVGRLGSAADQADIDLLLGANAILDERL